MEFRKVVQMDEPRGPGHSAPGQSAREQLRLSGDTSALFSSLYEELKNVAHDFMTRERSDHMLQTTALVNEVYLRFVGQEDARWKNRGHFLSIAAQAMRRVLVDQARKRRATKRCDGSKRVALDDRLLVAAADDLLVDILDLEEALCELEDLNTRYSRVVELRLFVGLTMKEIAEALGVTRRTVHGDLALARSWLCTRLGSQGAP